MEPEIAFALTVPPAGSRQLLRMLHAQLRDAIVGGRLGAGTRLPTTRAFAAAWGVSRNTALAIYDLLLSEGYVFARGKAGTFVAGISQRARRGVAARPRAPLNARWRSAIEEALPAPPLRFYFRLGVPELAGFPAPVWQRLATRTWRALTKQPAGYGSAQGQPALRAAIASHVSFARAVACCADDVIVTAGAQQAFYLLARGLVTAGDTLFAFEDPGYPPARAAFAAAGALLAPVPVDADGLVVGRIPAAARIVYVTPSHQFPLGAALSTARRTELLAFARRHGAVVIEDDYDGEFRFGARPLDALQTLDRDERVFYVGTFSKSLFPALRLGYVIAPAWARAALVAAKAGLDGHCPPLMQDTLAAFIAEGHLVRHVRRMRRVYATRRKLLLDALESNLSPWLEPLPGIAGLHVAAFARGRLDVPALIAHAREREVGLHALRPYCHGRARREGLTFGYGSIDEGGIAEGLSRLRRLLQRRG